MSIGYDSYFTNQFQDTYPGAYIANITPERFTEKVNEYVMENPECIVDGDNSFKKHIIMPNFVRDLKYTILPITTKIESLIRTKYEARKPWEAAVLIRYVPLSELKKLDIELPEAKFLDVEVYHVDQLIREDNESLAKGKKPEDCPFANADKLKLNTWYIITCKPQEEAITNVVTPDTIIRDAYLPGGNGTPFNMDVHKASVEWWKTRVMVNSNA